MNILQVSTADYSGGAERIAMNLHQEFRRRGHEAFLAVGRQVSRQTEPGVIPIPRDSGLWSEVWKRAGYLGVGATRSARLWRLGTAFAGDPVRTARKQSGREDFEFEGSRHLLDLPPSRPDVIVCHNLHGGYFDLRVLKELSRQLPVVMILHDQWTFTGHCAYSFGCERWSIGCGSCPDLTIHPDIPRDATRENLQVKAAIYRDSKLRVVTPSRWLMELARRSMLAQGMADSRVIPNGVDLAVFKPVDRAQARAQTGVPDGARVITCIASSLRTNRFKDFGTVERAAAGIAKGIEGEVVLLAVGDSAPERRLGNLTIRFVPFRSNPAGLVPYFQAAEVFLHAANVDNFPNTVLEAQACGIPVVATSVGGIPEQIEDGVTGRLVPVRDADSMAAAALDLLKNPAAAKSIAERARQRVETESGLVRHAQVLLDWFSELRGAAG